MNDVLYLCIAVLAAAAALVWFLAWLLPTKREKMRVAHKGNRVTEYHTLTPSDVAHLKDFHVRWDEESDLERARR